MNKSPAFTLIELLLTVVIIAILSGIVIAAINPEGIRAKGRDANRKKDITLISQALGQYYADNNQYPVAADMTALANALSPSSGVTYLKSFPSDTEGAYCYNRIDSQNYVLCSEMEASPAEINNIPAPQLCDPSSSFNASNNRFCVTNPF